MSGREEPPAPTKSWSDVLKRRGVKEERYQSAQYSQEEVEEAVQLQLPVMLDNKSNSVENGSKQKKDPSEFMLSKTKERRGSKMSIDRLRLAAFRFLCRQEEVKIWIEEIFNYKLEDFGQSLVEHIKDGTVLCKLANLIEERAIPKIHPKNSPHFLLMENITFFLEACKSKGWIMYVDLFMPIDLFEDKNIPKVINCLVLLDETIRKRGINLPTIRPLDPSKFESGFTEEQLQIAEVMLETAGAVEQQFKDASYDELKKAEEEERIEKLKLEEKKKQEELELKMREDLEMKIREEIKRKAMEEMEAENKRKEEEERQRMEEKRKKEEEERKRMEEERLKLEEEERIKREEEERLRKEEEERIRKEEEERKKLQEEEERLRREEMERQKLEEEEKRKKKEEEDRIKREEEERIRQEEELRRKKEEEEKRLEEERLKQEKKRLKEEKRKQKEEEERLKEEERLRKEEEKNQRRLEEEKRKREEYEREEEEKRKREEERKLKEEERAQMEEKKRLELLEEMKRKEKEAQARVEEEERQKKEQYKRRKDERKKREEEIKKKLSKEGEAREQRRLSMDEKLKRIDENRKKLLEEKKQRLEQQKLEQQKKMDAVKQRREEAEKKKKDSLDKPRRRSTSISSPLGIGAALRAKQISYRPVKDDPVDVMLSEFLAKERIGRQVKRLAQGKYMVNGVTVLMRCVNGNLVARVGGGWSTLEEYLEKHDAENSDFFNMDSQDRGRRRSTTPSPRPSAPKRRLAVRSFSVV